MCGYCVEIGAFQNMYQFKEMPDLIMTAFYLQETADLLKAMDAFLAKYAEVNPQPANVVETDFIERNSAIIVCRFLEKLVSDGFQTENMNQFLKSVLLQKALIYQCIENSGRIETLDKIVGILPWLKNAYSMSYNLNNGSLLNSAKVFKNIEYFYPLYSAETYLIEDRWQAYFERPDLLENCLALLNDYLNWWLTREGVKSIDSEEIRKSLEGTHVTLDPMMTVPKEARVILDTVFRAIYFSLLYTGRSGLNLDLLKKIVILSPPHVPLFDGMDLWLRRKAAELLYRMEGLKFFIENMRDISMIVAAYVVNRCEIRGPERALLIEKLPLSKYYDKDDAIWFSLCDPVSQDNG